MRRLRDSRALFSLALLASALGPGCTKVEPLGPGDAASDLGAGPLADLLQAVIDLARPAGDMPGGDMAVSPSDMAALADMAAPTDRGGMGLCLGVKPPMQAYNANPSPRRFGDGGSGAGVDGMFGGGLTAGDPVPRWALYDFQPQSCGFGATYGLDLFKGRPLIVALWAGW